MASVARLLAIDKNLLSCTNGIFAYFFVLTHFNVRRDGDVSAPSYPDGPVVIVMRVRALEGVHPPLESASTTTAASSAPVGGASAAAHRTLVTGTSRPSRLLYGHHPSTPLWKLHPSLKVKAQFNSV